MKYVWKQQTVTNMPAQIVGMELMRIEKKYKGVLLPSTIVEEAKPKRAVLHDCFEWDDRKAAGKFRENQARELLRKITIVYTDKGKEEKIRCFVRIQNETQSFYTATARIIEDEELQENVLEQILQDLMAIKKKYGQFKSPKLQKIWDAIEEVLVEAA